MSKGNFVENGDAYGKCFRCNECGKNQFYVDKPVKCDHKPEQYEIDLHKGHNDRKAEKMLRAVNQEKDNHK